MLNKAQKPEGSTWTDDQWDAIAIHGHDMLVAAAAGSGKTAVLVERIIRRISDEHDPIDVDRLLVATFTNAAAAEMRHRISEALEKALERNPGSDHIRRQLALIARASITTLHSFCLEVIRTHYQRIGLDPGFRIANETESELMRQDLMEELLEEQYGDAQEGSDFWLLLEWFGGEKSDDALFRLIQRLFDESRSHPNPAQWLTDMAGMFNRTPEDESVSSENPWLSSLLASVRLELEGISAILQEAMKLAEAPGGPAPYMQNLREDLESVTYLLQVADYSWEHLYDSYQGTTFGKLKPCKGDQYDKELQEQVKELRTKAKERLTGIGEELFGRTLEQYDEELRMLAPLMMALVGLVIEFGRRYQDGKKAKGLVDFGDLEHFCLQILSDDSSDALELQPSAIALQYRDHFAEVLLDEYQDTNRVQEAIVALISRAQPGNRFMVGDVKQSIYRFRLAEPGLFLEKYKSYKTHGTEPGQKIDLAKNFRSRRSVVDGVNYIFRQVMGETVGEIAYDERAELAYGAAYYPEWPEETNGSEAAELLLVDRTEEEPGLSEDSEIAETSGAAPSKEEDNDTLNEARELETVQLEARVIAGQIHKLLGTRGGQAFQVYDKSSGGQRDITFRDIVILLRATQAWSPVIIEELRHQGIPAYAELSSGYFSATEIEVLLSLLQIIDNPYQDIPLAAVLRSPIVQLTEEQLAQIRIAGRQSFYDAVRLYALSPKQADASQESPTEYKASAAELSGGWDEAAVGTHMEMEDRMDPANALQMNLQWEADTDSQEILLVRVKLNRFLEQLQSWRQAAHQGSLSDLIWTLYRETGFYDYVGGMPGGQQRQANLRALYDRAKQYEATSFRGLFRFLRFIERMKDSGGDLGTARALGEQEDVVRIMSIHKSKGLEFPVVFVAGMAKKFNQRDLTNSFMVHKDLGFGPKFMDTHTRVNYPTLPWLAIRRKMRMEMLAEEMRVLYVALTRAREKLYLLATVKGTDKLLHKWSRALEHHEELLPNDVVAQAGCYLDWIGPAIMRHPDGHLLRDYAGVPQRIPAVCSGDASEWQVHLLQPELFVGIAEAAGAAEVNEERKQSVLRLESVDDHGDLLESQVWHRLNWQYSFTQASALLSKTSVTELKRLSEHHRLLELVADEPQAEMLQSGSLGGSSYRPAIARRPRFLEQKKLNAAERGTVFHAVMQHMAIDKAPTLEEIRETLAAMVRKQLLTEEQSEVVDGTVIASFFQSDLGQRLLQAARIHREVPFSYGLPARDVYSDTDATTSDETILLQGVIDCLFEEEQGFVLLDYKTDHVRSGSTAELQTIRERYKLQLDLYARAVEKIWRKPVVGKFIFLFDGAHVLEL